MSDTFGQIPATRSRTGQVEGALVGMFDYIRCRIPLPKEPPPPDIEWFQTKDVPTLQLYLEKWTIEADGRLIKHGVRYEDQSDPNAEPGSIESLRGLITAVAVPEDDEEIPLHGDVEFHHYDSRTKVFWEYVARFTEGRCVRVFSNTAHLEITDDDSRGNVAGVVQS